MNLTGDQERLMMLPAVVDRDVAKQLDLAGFRETSTTLMWQPKERSRRPA